MRKLIRTMIKSLAFIPMEVGESVEDSNRRIREEKLKELL